MIGDYLRSDSSESTTRLCLVWMTFVVSITWSINSIVSRCIHDIPMGVVTIMLGLAGLKGYQRVTESKEKECIDEKINRTSNEINTGKKGSTHENPGKVDACPKTISDADE